MAASVVSAVRDKWAGLTAALFPGSAVPPLYFDYVPAADSSGVQERPLYGVLRDDTGFAPEYQSDFGGIEVGELTVEVYADTLAAVDQAVKAVKWNGLAPSSRNGLDFCTLSLTSPYYPIVLKRVKERRAYAGFNYLGQPAYACFLTYACVTGVTATGSIG
jgi:hypothetical protein